jgi:hypothetical protein
MSRIEKIKNKYPHPYYSDGDYIISSDDFEYLLRIADAAEHIIANYDMGHFSSNKYWIDKLRNRLMSRSILDLRKAIKDE